MGRIKERIVRVGVLLTFFSILVCGGKPEIDDIKNENPAEDNVNTEKKDDNILKKEAFLDEIGALKGELKSYLSQAESIRKQIISKMYGIQARKAIVDKIKDFIAPAKNLLEKSEEREKNVCVTPAVIEDAYARLLEEERRKKYEEEKARMEEQRRQQQQQQQQQQQTRTPSPTS